MQAIQVPVFIGIAVADGKVEQWRHFELFDQACEFYANFTRDPATYSDVRVLRLVDEDLEMEDMAEAIARRLALKERLSESPPGPPDPPVVPGPPPVG